MPTTPKTTLTGEPSECSLEAVQSPGLGSTERYDSHPTRAAKSATLHRNRAIEKTPDLVVQPTGVDDVVAASNVGCEDDRLLSGEGW
jgi:hypothetical protein